MSRRSIKFMRALVVASGLASVTSCGRVGLNEPSVDGGPMVLADGGSADAGRDAGTDAGLTCAQCDCFRADAGKPSCDSVMLTSCCLAVGPLAPPDLPAVA